MVSHVPFIEDERPEIGVGRLGATCHHAHAAQAAQLDMIERRILRIEMALRRTGVEVEWINLPK